MPLLCCAALIVLSACGSDDDNGELAVLTYNVAGLPQGISKSDPERTIPLISPLLDAHDLVLVQEDFAYHDALSAQVTLPYKSVHRAQGPGGGRLGDGLNRFSRAPFREHTRESYTRCNGLVDSGSDCLAAKGFTHAVHELAPGVEVIVYNTHLDASGSDEDQAARSAQVDELLASLKSHDAAVILGGDTNLKPSRGIDGETLSRLRAQGKLDDACLALDCGDVERIDRVYFRSSASVRLEAVSWQVDRRYVDADGKDLSDHEAVAVHIRWQRR